MERLPRDIDLALINSLEWPENINLCKTNKQWVQICKDQQLWRNFIKRDFPKYYKYKNKGQNNRELYNKLWTLINSATNDLMENLLMANPRYINKELMEKDITKMLITAIEDNARSKDFKYRYWQDLQYIILSILSGLSNDNIGSYSDGNLDFWRKELYLENNKGIQNLFYQLGYKNQGKYFITPPEEYQSE